MTSPSATPTPAVSARPAYDAYRAHVLWARHVGDLNCCDECRQLYADASAESWRRAEARRAERRRAGVL